MPRKNGCFFEKIAQEFERVATLTRGAPKTKDTDSAGHLAVLASSMRADCDCSRHGAAAPDGEKSASTSKGTAATK